MNEVPTSLTRPRRPLVVAWTPAEDEKLKALVAQGASALKVAAAMNRSTSAVRIRARKINLSLPTVREARKKWMPEKPKKNGFLPY